MTEKKSDSRVAPLLGMTSVLLEKLNLAEVSDGVKRIAKWISIISITVFVIDWGIMGLKLLDNNYLITAEAYIGLISLIVCFVCLMYIKITNRCPHCGKTKQSFGKYCPYCGKEIN